MTSRGKARTNRPRERQELHHRLPRAATRLGDTAAEETQVVVRRVRPHPKALTRTALLVFLAVIATSSTFWFVLLQEDAALRLFFPSRDYAGLIFVAAAWGIVTQVLAPLSIVRRLQTSRRLLVSRSLKLVLAWGATGVGSLLLGVVSDAVSAWFMGAAALLLPAAFALFRIVRAAVAADG